jgi:LysM repeat protein
MKAIAVWILLSAVGFTLSGCMTTPDTVTPVTTQIAQMRSQIRRMDDKTEALQQSIDDVDAKIKAVESESAHIQSVIKQDQNTVYESLQKMDDARKQDIKIATDSLARGNAQELERMNRTLAKVVDTVEQENKDIRKDVSSDIATLQKGLKQLEIKLNTYMDKTDRLQKELNNLSKVSSSKPTSSSGTGTGTKKPTQKQAIVRTGTPSNPDIDYVNVYKHTVVSGESLWKIARDYNVTIQDILNVNENIDDMTSLTIGQTLYVPSHKSDQ